MGFKGLNAELNPICHVLALLESHHILHVSRIRINPLKTKYVRVLSCSVSPDMRKSIASFAGSQASPTCPYDSSIKVKVSTQDLWDVTGEKTEPVRHLEAR